MQPAKEGCGSPDSHEWELSFAVENIDHTEDQIHILSDQVLTFTPSRGAEKTLRQTYGAAHGELLEERNILTQGGRMYKGIAACVLSFALGAGSSVLTPSAAQAQGVVVRWERIIGLQQAFDLVGAGTGQVTGAAPWETTAGSARLNLQTGKLSFTVRGLVLAVGSAGDGAFTGLDIGSAAGVTQVKGTLVCDVNGSAGGNSVLVDTPTVALSAQGDARFTGDVGTLPTVCTTEPDIAFLIRIVEPEAFADRWIAAGAVRVP